MNQVADNFLSVSSNPSSSSSPIDNKFDMDGLISPIVVLYISLISIIFFVFSLLHLLIRFLLKPRPLNDTAYDDEENAALFNLRNSGVDQSFIDALPLIHYKTIIGLGQDPFDCAVCLNEFNAEDELRLLPKCSHAFHMDCIDTWLLTNSTCPLCRDNILLSVTPRSSSHSVLVLESSDDESSRESDFSLESTHFDDAGSKSDDLSGQNDDGFPATHTNSLTFRTRDMFWHAWRRYKLLDSSSLVNDCV